MPISDASRHTTSCILSVCALLHNHFHLPTEIISIILDHAAYWVCTTTTRPFTREHCSYSPHYTLLATSPLSHSTASSPPGMEQLKVPSRGRFPCRRIAVTVRAQAEQRPKEYHSQFSHMTPGGWYEKPPGRNPVIVSVLWAGLPENADGSLRGKTRDQVFSASNIPSVLDLDGREWPQEGSIPIPVKARVPGVRTEVPRRVPRLPKRGIPVGWSIPVIEEALSRHEMEEREVVWDWTHEGAGGDLVRALVAGDALELAANHRAFGWGTTFTFLEVNLFHAI